LLLASFGRVEHQEMDAGTHEKNLRRADELDERFHVPKAIACGPCGHHAEH
jgi:hypothetical protein